MRQSTSLLARRLATSLPSLVAGGAGVGAAALPVASAALLASPHFAIARSAFHASSTPFAAEAASTSSSSGPLNARAECGDVPEGHKDSDLSHHVNNIGLGRRRDLTLRPDVRLHGPTEGEHWRGRACCPCATERERAKPLRPSTTPRPTHAARFLTLLSSSLFPSFL